jgi:hypothetical protein
MKNATIEKTSVPHKNIPFLISYRQEYAIKDRSPFRLYRSPPKKPLHFRKPRQKQALFQNHGILSDFIPLFAHACRLCQRDG